MRIIETQPVVVDREKIKDIICNRCGQSCFSVCDYEGLLDAHVYGGYGAHHLGDTNEYAFDVCEVCLAEWFKSFKHNPFVTTYNPWIGNDEGNE